MVAYSELPDLKGVDSDELVDFFVSLRSQTRKKFGSENPSSSVKSSNAQIPDLCYPGNLSALDLSVDHLLSHHCKELGTYEKAILELQVLYGLRITEALNIRYSDITSLGAIHVKGLKGSMDRLVYPVNYRNFWLVFSSNRVILSRGYNRYYFYRLYKKLGVYSIVSGNKNSSVTHLLRYQYIISLMKQNLELEEIRQLIGHKSIKSTLHYVVKAFKS